MMEVYATTPRGQPRQVGFPAVTRRSKRRASPIDLEARPSRKCVTASQESRQYSSISPAFPGSDRARRTSTRQLAAGKADSGDFARVSPPVADSITVASCPSPSTGATAAVDRERRPHEDHDHRGFRWNDRNGLQISEHAAATSTTVNAPAPVSQCGPLPALSELHTQRLGLYSPVGSDHSGGQYNQSSSHFYPPPVSSSPNQAWYSGTGPQQQSPALSITSHCEPYPSTVPASRIAVATGEAVASPRRKEPPPAQPSAPLLQAEVAHLATSSLTRTTSSPNPLGPRVLSHLFDPDESLSTAPHGRATIATTNAIATTAATTATTYDRSVGQLSSFATSNPDLSAPMLGISSLVKPDAPTSPASHPPASYYFPQYQDLQSSITQSSHPTVPSVRSLALLPPTSRPQSPPFLSRGQQGHLDGKRLDRIVAAPPSQAPYAPSLVSYPRPQLPPLFATQVGSAAYTHSQQSGAGSLPQVTYHQSTTYPVSDAHSIIPRHPNYYAEGHNQAYQHHPQHLAMSNDADSESWLLLPSCPQNVEDDALPLTPESATAIGYPYRPISETEVLPVLASNGMEQQWVDASVELDREESANATRPTRQRGGVALFVPVKSTKGQGRAAGRAPFNEERRQATGLTRKQGACVRCKMQRIRCIASDPTNPHVSCEPCLKVDLTSKKTIHHIPCRRYKLSEAVLGRQGGLNLTRRWEGVKMTNVGDRADDVIRIVEIKIFYTHEPNKPDLYSKPMCFEVCRFIPRDGDVLERNWRTRDNQVRRTPLTPFSFVDIHASSKALENFIHENAKFAMENALRESQPIIRDTYGMAVTHFSQLLQTNIDSAECKFWGHLFRLWFAMRMTTGSAYISGTDRLDMVPETHPDYPLRWHVSLPRMLTAQFDSIISTMYLRQGTAHVVKYLENFVRSSNPECWFTIYLATFILLHEISHSTRDRGRHGRDNGTPTRFSLPAVVEAQHKSANILLLHWHYFKSELDPSNTAPEDTARTPMAALTDDQKRFVWWSWGVMTDPAMTERVLPPDPRDQERQWEEPLYFVAQMFTNRFSEMATFQG